MPNFSSENALIDRLFLKNLPDAVVYDSEFVGDTDDFIDFCKLSVNNFLNYLIQNNSNPESHYVLYIYIYPKVQFTKSSWIEMFKNVFGGLNASVIITSDSKKKTIKLTFSKTFSETTYSVYLT